MISWKGIAQHLRNTGLLEEADRLSGIVDSRTIASMPLGLDGQIRLSVSGSALDPEYESLVRQFVALTLNAVYPTEGKDD